jgi:hypothetical protein
MIFFIFLIINYNTYYLLWLLFTSWQPQIVKWECLLFETQKNQIKFSLKKDLGKIHHISTELFTYF